MRKRGQQMGSVLSDAYERLVAANHFLRRVSCALDFGFVDGLCRDKYKSADGGPGRPAEPSARLFKLLLLMFLYLVEQCIYRSLSMHRIQTAMSFFALDLEKLVRYAPA